MHSHSRSHGTTAFGVRASQAQLLRCTPQAGRRTRRHRRAHKNREASKTAGIRPPPHGMSFHGMAGCASAAARQAGGASVRCTRRKQACPTLTAEHAASTCPAPAHNPAAPQKLHTPSQARPWPCTDATRQQVQAGPSAAPARPPPCWRRPPMCPAPAMSLFGRSKKGPGRCRHHWVPSPLLLLRRHRLLLRGQGGQLPTAAHARFSLALAHTHAHTKLAQHSRSCRPLPAPRPALRRRLDLCLGNGAVPGAVSYQPTTECPLLPAYACTGASLP
jgi:hypothetical protein